MSIMESNQNTISCPVCSGTMLLVKVVPINFRLLKRYRCTCGHLEERPDAEPSPVDRSLQVAAVPGFSDLP